MSHDGFSEEIEGETLVFGRGSNRGFDLGRPKILDLSTGID
jgi:hypothetical protein